MTVLNDFVEPLKRELAVPGLFDEVFPNVGDDDLAAALADGFAEAQLRGFFGDITLSEDAGQYTTSSDLSAAGGATVVIFTGMRVLRAHLRSLNTMERYKAGPTEFEIQRAATMLRGELDYLQQRLNEIIDESKRAKAPVACQVDNYYARLSASFGGFYRHELV